MSSASLVGTLYTAIANADYSPQSIVPGQNKLSPTFSNDVRSSTTVTTTSMSLATLLATPNSVTIGTNSSRNSSSSASRHYQPPPTVSSSIPHSSIGIDRQSNSRHPTSFVPATEARSLVSPQRPNAEDGVLNSVSTEPRTLGFNSSSINSPRTPLPLEGALEQTLPLTVLLGALQREQLQEIHAKGGFAGFTAQEIEGWVAADQA